MLFSLTWIPQQQGLFFLHFSSLSLSLIVAKNKKDQSINSIYSWTALGIKIHVLHTLCLSQFQYKMKPRQLL